MVDLQAGFLSLAGHGRQHQEIAVFTHAQLGKRLGDVLRSLGVCRFPPEGIELGEIEIHRGGHRQRHRYVQVGRGLFGNRRARRRSQLVPIERLDELAGIGQVCRDGGRCRGERRTCSACRLGSRCRGSSRGCAVAVRRRRCGGFLGRWIRFFASTRRIASRDKERVRHTTCRQTKAFCAASSGSRQDRQRPR